MDSSITNMVLWFAVFFGIIYFIIIRPNNKQQKERRMMLDSLKEKDKVVTIGGLHGTVTKIMEDTVMIKVASHVELEFTKSAVQTIENRDYKQGKGKARKLKPADTEVTEETAENEAPKVSEVKTEAVDTPEETK
ncbi:MAG: preprotein translocase subunit YajC [Peptococcaceae bacterium]|nr:preprotein translocase subunit YajC [Peptococcaceae bacterium]